MKSSSEPSTGSVLAAEVYCEMPQKPSFVMGVEVGAELVENPGVLAQAAQEDLPDRIFKASALWADAFYKSKCPSVCMFVRLFVRLFTFEVPFNGLFAPTS